MLGFIIGTACLFGLIKVLRHSRYGYGGYRACGGGGWGHRGGGWGRHGWGRGGWGGGDFRERGGWGSGEPFFLRALFEQLDATPGQEKVIKSAIDEVREAARSVRGEAQGSRADVAKAVRSESFDEVLFGEMFHRHDVAMDTMRKAVMGAIAKVHAALDERQRARLATLIEEGPRAFFRGGSNGPRGPWRGNDAYAV